MTAAAGAKPTVFLRDYRAPAWRVVDVALVFDLDPSRTIVAATLTVEADPDQAGAPLRLDGEGLELLELRVDGRALAASEYVLDAQALTIASVPSRATIETRASIAPDRNTALQGLYLSGTRDGGFLVTQCEAEGFRRITWFVDRPDVLARYTVALRADKARFPLLLANGNEVERGDLEGGRHFARFVDPHPKPSYLFALVAGRLDRIEDAFVTSEGRRVRLAIHAETDLVARCAWAMQCLKLAMRWDEQRFGRCYDLDVYHVVATRDFTMGAMENKGLNIFNAKYLVADPEHATDDDYRHVLAVVGHEYFHNWSGNRVTCRDWFQLSLKEGLTVFREQEFESDLASRTLRRIEDVRTLWRAQFSEDAGPLAHPVRPDRYSEINNFYTATVYDKGAEIVRMLAVLLGNDGFRRGLDLYFERHDGKAVAVEDFLAALGEANGRDLSAWLGWYNQAGTPCVSVRGRYHAASKHYEIAIAQKTPPTPNQPRKHALPLPIAVQLFGADGRALRVRLDGEANATTAERILPLAGDEATFRFVDVPEPPVVSLLRGYSAPVRLEQNADDATLASLVRHDTDGFNRWFAGDTLVRRLFASALASGEYDASLAKRWTDAIAAVLDDASVDPALAAEMLSIADATALTAGLADIDPEAVHRARTAIECALSRALASALRERYARLGDSGTDTSLEAQARRRLRNVCLAALVRSDAKHLELARAQFFGAANLTDRLAALGVLVSANATDAQAALDAFAARYSDDAIVLDKWFSVQATHPEPSTLARVEALTQHPAFSWQTPNCVYALLVAFAHRNPRAFHRADGAAYRFIADAVVRIDAINPQVAARLVTAFGPWRSYEPVRRALMRRELERLAGRSGNSPDLADLVGRALV